MHSICVWNMMKQSKPLQKRYDRTYIYDRYCIRTHVYVFRLVWKNACLNNREFDLEGDQAFHYTTKTCLKTVGHCGYEWVEKESVGLQRTWVSKLTVSVHIYTYAYHATTPPCSSTDAHGLNFFSNRGCVCQSNFENEAIQPSTCINMFFS